MWQFNLLSIVKEAVENESYPSITIILMIIIIVILIIYTLSKNMTDK